MKKWIEWIKKVFFKKLPALEETTTRVENQYSNEKEAFVNTIKVENEATNLLAMQKKLEDGLMDENSLSTEEVIKMKDLYHSQVMNLIENIKKYKLKLNENE